MNATPIEDMDLSVRAYNCLKRAGIDTAEQLSECTTNDLLNIRNIRASSISEIKEKLAEMDLRLSERWTNAMRYFRRPEDIANMRIYDHKGKIIVRSANEEGFSKEFKDRFDLLVWLKEEREIT